MTPKLPTSSVKHVCPVCGDGGHLSLLCSADGADVYTCATCSADHVFPMPDPRALKAYYDRREWFEGGEKGGYENYDAQTSWSVDLMGSILARFAGQSGLSILDIGCGYGTHLAAAAKLGWKCFGVEPSAHARAMAQERLGGTAYVVESVTDLIPHEFDVVLMLDVIEHLPSPYPTFYQLFSIGAITAKTLVIITTPNAGSADAQCDPAAWPYRHPASHLVHYTAKALDLLLRRLHFATPTIKGLTEGPAPGDDLAASAGLLVTTQGSDFAEFMRERYVPGTWSKLAEYEHLPRYALAKTLVDGKTVLDFGCGTGYGAALMAETAASVTGLDIDAAALAWAGESHRNPHLVFRRHDDLGATLPDKSFDLVTCFEMIEHVDYPTQQAAVANMARLLRDDGLLIISTPNPEVTALYGANPYHLREMSEAEFRDLLGPHFPHIRILRQFVRVGIAIDQEDTDARLVPGAVTGTTTSETKPLAFIALCSRQSVPDVPNRVLFDQNIDFIEQFMMKEEALYKTRLEAYERGERAQSLDGQFLRAMSELNRVISERDDAHAAIVNRTQDLHESKLEIIARTNDLNLLEHRRLNEKGEYEAALQTLEHRRANEQSAAEATRAALQRTREEEHNSPRFLFKQFWRAMRTRLSGQAKRG